MAPRYPQGSLFIVDPTVKPTDGDVVLVRFKEDQELTLRELKIDLPEKFLLSLTTATKAIEYHQDFHEIVGVNMLTVLYNQRILR
jgi:SOS-response transcriptional repressor LexA